MGGQGALAVRLPLLLVRSLLFRLSLCILVPDGMGSEGSA